MSVYYLFAYALRNFTSKDIKVSRANFLEVYSKALENPQINFIVR